jgi:hypothetical protein
MSDQDTLRALLDHDASDDAKAAAFMSLVELLQRSVDANEASAEANRELAVQGRGAPAWLQALDHRVEGLEIEVQGVRRDLREAKEQRQDMLDELQAQAREIAEQEIRIARKEVRTSVGSEGDKLLLTLIPGGLMFAAAAHEDLFESAGGFAAAVGLPKWTVAPIIFATILGATVLVRKLLRRLS